LGEKTQRENQIKKVARRGIERGRRKGGAGYQKGRTNYYVMARGIKVL